MVWIFNEKSFCSLKVLPLVYLEILNLHYCGKYLPYLVTWTVNFSLKHNVFLISNYLF